MKIMSHDSIDQLTRRLNNTYVGDQRVGITFKLDANVTVGQEDSSLKWELSLLSLDDISRICFVPWHTITINHADITSMDSIDILLFFCGTVAMKVKLNNCTVDYSMLCVRAAYKGCYADVKQRIFGLDAFMSISSYESESA